MKLDEAKKILKDDIDKDDGGLNGQSEYISWLPKDEKACLDGDFTSDELIAMGVYMKAMKI